jgi:two-component system nitrate/nitrite response regulator NarL
VSEPLRVFLVDDHALCQRGLADLLGARGGIEVVGATADGNAAPQLIGDLAPDIVVMDLRMPKLDGIALLRRLRDAESPVPLVVLTVSDSEEDLANAFRAGVRGYLLKDMDPDDIVDAIVRAAHGDVVVAPAMATKLGRLLQSGAPKPAAADRLDLLTAREHQILEHLARGESNKAIARALDISHDTVKLHVRHILAKLNLTSRVEAAIYAVEHRSASGTR